MVQSHDALACLRLLFVCPSPCFSPFSFTTLLRSLDWMMLQFACNKARAIINDDGLDYRNKINMRIQFLIGSLLLLLLRRPLLCASAKVFLLRVQKQTHKENNL